MRQTEPWEASGACHSSDRESLSTSDVRLIVRLILVYPSVSELSMNTRLLVRSNDHKYRRQDPTLYSFHSKYCDEFLLSELFQPVHEV